MNNLFLGCFGSELVTLSGHRQISSKCCGGDHILSCRSATVNINNLNSPQIELPSGLALNLMNQVQGNTNSYHYGSDDGEAVMTMNAEGVGLHGHATSADGLALRPLKNL